MKKELTISFNIITGSSVKVRMIKKRMIWLMERSNTFSNPIAIKNATAHGKSALTLGCEKIVLISDAEVKF